jgi:5-formyltetrahydrofolate cyclo-ligase
VGPPAGRETGPLSGPPHGRIPNFAGAAAAAERLFEVEPWQSARCIKVNPDAPQRPVRAAALRRGITVFVPTPCLRAGFKRLDPARIAEEQIEAASSLSKGDRFAEAVPLEALPAMDAIVCGSVAVTRDGRRCGKGEGYSDLEYAILSSAIRRCPWRPRCMRCRSWAGCRARQPTCRSR